MRKTTLFFLGLVVTMLVTLGLIVLSSASEANAIRLHHGDAYFFLRRQLIYLGVGLVVMVVTALLDYRIWTRHFVLTVLVYGVVFALLLMVFPMFGGRAINGSFRWINCGPINIQPSELAKLVVVLMVAAWMDQAGWKVDKLCRGMLVPCLMIGGLALPIILETDLGSTMVVGAVGMLIMFVAGTRILHLGVAFAVGAAVFGGRMFTDHNRVRRFLSFVNRASESSDQLANVNTSTMDAASYQAHNALVAFKNGGIFGVGFGESMQKQAYLPEAHTDFIFAIGAEELGVFFSVGTLLLFIAFFAISVYIARQATDRFGRFLVIGMSFIIVFQAFFNLGVVCEALPTKGMALPFFSYGGTNIISACFAVGTIFSVGIHSYRDRKRMNRSVR